MLVSLFDLEPFLSGLKADLRDLIASRIVLLSEAFPECVFMVLETNGLMSALYVKKWGGIPRYLDVVPDNPDSIKMAIEANMSFKSFLLKRLIVWDFIPYSLRWKKSVSGIGMIYVGTLEMMQEKYGKDGVDNLNEIMYNIGLGQSTEILKMLDLNKDMEGCAYVLLSMHRIFGIKSKIIQKDSNKIVIHVLNLWESKHIHNI